MNPYSWPCFVTGIGTLFLGIFVYLKGWKKTSNITLSLSSFATSLWSLSQVAGEFFSQKAAVLFLTRLSGAGAIFIPVFYLHFVLSILDEAKKRKKLIYFSYLVGMFFLILDLTPLHIRDVVPRLTFKYVPLPGPAYPFFVGMLILMVAYGMGKLFLALRNTFGQRRSQIAYVLLASLISFAGGVTAFFPVFGLQIYPFGYFLIPFYPFVAGYAIIKHRIMDISIVIRQSLVYSVLVGLFTGSYLVLMLSLGRVLQNVTRYDSFVVSAILVFAAALGFQPLRTKLQEGIDRLFFKSKYDYQATLRSLSEKVISILRLEELLSLVIQTIAGTMKIKSATILLLDEKRAQLVVREKIGEIEEGAIDAASDFAASLGKGGVVFKDAEVCFPLRTKNKLVGVLCLGEKISQDAFSREDIDLLATLANQLAIAVENGKLYEEILATQRQLYQADKLATLGKVAADMAHEIKNPLASIKGLSQVLEENVGDHEFLLKFKDIVPRQLDRINKAVENLLHFGRPAKPKKVLVDVGEALRETLRFVSNQCQKANVEIAEDFAPNSKVLADPEQLAQVFLNLVLNAIQAMPGGGKLKVKTNALDDGKTKIIIADTGIGISQEKVKNIFDPFFTTKEGGVGLGLSIVQRIIKEHEGTIEVKSKAGEGTTFNVFL